MSNLVSEKERSIFDAVLRLADRGVDLATVRMQEIAAEAGMGKSTLYEYFASKEELLLSTMHYCLRQEIAHLAAKVQNCNSFLQLLDTLEDYAAELVMERVASYGMLGRIFSGRDPSQDCPFMLEVRQAFGQLVKFGHALAKQDALTSEEDTGYFEHVLTSAMIAYAVNLLRMKNLGQLTEERQQQLNLSTRRMMLGALKN